MIELFMFVYNNKPMNKTNKIARKREKYISNTKFIDLIEFIIFM